MLILLPPSEGKLCPARGKALALDQLKDPTLSEARERVLSDLMGFCRSEPEQARQVLGLSEKLAHWVRHNRDLAAAPTATASRIYTGVLFGELGLTELIGQEARRANRRLIIFSALFGLIRPHDRIPCYRLSGNVTLPDVGSLTKFWRGPISVALQRAPGKQLIVDMRSAPYAAMWSPDSESNESVVQVKIWQRAPSGLRTAVSHHNKATKGQLARHLATTRDDLSTATELLDATLAHGWQTELDDSTNPTRLDVYITG